MRRYRSDFKMPQIGKKFGKLTVVQILDDDFVENKSGCRIPILCKCECGGFTITDRWAVESGHKTACENCSACKGVSVDAYKRATQKNNTTGYRGIDVNGNKYRVRYYFKNKVLFNQKYDTYEEAIAARKAIEIVISKLFGGEDDA